MTKKILRKQTTDWEKTFTKYMTRTCIQTI